MLLFYVLSLNCVLTRLLSLVGMYFRVFLENKILINSEMKVCIYGNSGKCYLDDYIAPALTDNMSTVTIPGTLYFLCINN